MCKPATSVLGRDQFQRLADGFLYRFSCASRSPTQGRFQLGEGFLNGRKIRGITGQKEQLTASRFDGVAHLDSLTHEMRNEHEQASSERETSKRANNDVFFFFHHFVLFSHLVSQ